MVTCTLTSGTTAASWNVWYDASAITTGKKLTVTNTQTLSGTDGQTMTFPAASTTLAGLGTTQTFTGANTFNNANVLAGAATMAVFNTTATNLSIGGAATTFNLGGTPTTGVTANIFANATASAQSKTLNIGTAGVSGSLTAINLGSAVSGATNTLRFNITPASDATGDLYYRNSSGNVSRLGIGSGTQVLGVSGGLPAWVAAATGTIGGSIASNQIAVGSGANTISGSSGFTATGGVVLMNNGALGSGATTAYQVNTSNVGLMQFAVDRFFKTNGAGLLSSTSPDGIVISADNNTQHVDILANGNVGIGVITPTSQLHTSGTVRFAAFGAGTLTSDASGNITSISDVRLKKDIKPSYVGLKEVMKLQPITYRWNEKSGNEMDSTYTGFAAQNVQENIQNGTGKFVGKDGVDYLTLQDRAILAALTNAIKEQQSEILKLKKEITKLKKKN